VFLTAHSDEERLARARPSRPLGYLVKPVQERDLRITVEMALYAARADAARKRAEDALRESEERFELFMKHLPGVAFIKDAEGRTLFANDLYYISTGFKPGAVIGKQDRDHLPPKTAEGFYEEDRTVLDQGRALRIEQEYSGPQGRIHWLTYKFPIFRQGRPDLIGGISIDITALKRAEAAVKRSEERFQLAVGGSQDGLWDWYDLKADRGWVSPRFFGLLGYEDGEFEPSSAVFMEHVHPEDRERLNQAVRAQLSVGAGFEIECRLRTKAGAYRWFHGRGRAIRDQAGRVSRFSGSIQDIQERKAAEQALVREKERFRVLVEHSPLGVALVDRGGGYRYVNPKFVEIFGYELEDVPDGRSWFGKAFPDPDKRRVVRSAWLSDMEKIGPGEARPRTYMATCRDGSEKEILFRPVALENGDQVVIYEDITDRVDWERALKESEEKYRVLVEHSGEGICILQGDPPRFIFVNSAMSKITGYEADELMEMDFDGILELIHPDDLDMTRQRFFERLSGLSPPNRYEIRLIRKDGRPTWIDLYSGAVDIRGRPAVQVGMRDVTENRRFSERIQAALKEKDVLLKEIHHRVKNNMQVVTSLLNIQGARESNLRVVEALKESRDRVGAMALVHEFLFQSESLAEIDLGDYVKRLAEVLVRSYSTRSPLPEVRVVVPKGLRVGPDQAVPCGLVLNELITNALKHAFPDDRQGVITIGIHEDPPGRIRLKVGDNGVGLPEGLDWRASKTVGLSLVVALAEHQLEGEVDLDRGEGACFSVSFELTR
ncbi:MAG: PAS domain S-box protein, partial [Proteobacteria bacterium]|nr:PAS domain S-box protein [Pseudomonadota bacterium]